MVGKRATILAKCVADFISLSWRKGKFDLVLRPDVYSKAVAPMNRRPKTKPKRTAKSQARKTPSR